jgi:hypothetical protein
VQDDNLVTCVLRMHPKHRTRLQILKPYTTFNLRLHKVVIHLVAEVLWGRNSREQVIIFSVLSDASHGSRFAPVRCAFTMHHRRSNSSFRESCF